VRSPGRPTTYGGPIVAARTGSPSRNTRLRRRLQQTEDSCQARPHAACGETIRPLRQRSLDMPARQIHDASGVHTQQERRHDPNGGRAGASGLFGLAPAVSPVRTPGSGGRRAPGGGRCPMAPGRTC
jgi:hypothetical protein